MYDVDVRATLNAPMFKHEKINVFVWHGKREPWPIFSVDFELKISTKHTAYILSVALKTERKKWHLQLNIFQCIESEGDWCNFLLIFHIYPMERSQNMPM